MTKPKAEVTTSQENTGINNQEGVNAPENNGVLTEAGTTANDLQDVVDDIE